MTAKDLLTRQLTGSFNILRDRMTTVSDQEWSGRSFPGSNLPGFIFWHAARILDWAVHCGIQGVPEVATRPHWQALRATEFVYGAGIPQTEADEVARSVGKSQVLGYLDDVREASLGWLATQSEEDLERIPELEAHQKVNPRYLAEPVWAEVSSLAGKPAWEILMGPCISHIRLHAGEIDTLIQTLRAPGRPR